MTHEFIHPSELKPDKHYGITLLAWLINGTYELVFWTGTEFFHHKGNYRLSDTIIRQVMVLEVESKEPFTANIQHVKRPIVSDFKQSDFEHKEQPPELKQEEPPKKGKFFNPEANQHQEGKSESGPYAKKLPF